jgi:hypothetical protein
MAQVLLAFSSNPSTAKQEGREEDLRPGEVGEQQL